MKQIDIFDALAKKIASSARSDVSFETSRRVFTAIAGLAAVFSPFEADAFQPCTAPFGGGQCSSSECSGSQCNQYGAQPTYGYCYTQSANCWSSGGGTCCDCFGYTNGYCYCYA